MNHGSKKPLNYGQKTAPIPEHKDAPKNLVSRVSEHFRAGTPITRKGSFQGYFPRLYPNADAPELSPTWTLGGELQKSVDNLNLLVSQREAALDHAFVKAMGEPNVPRKPQNQNGFGQSQQKPEQARDANAQIPGANQTGQQLGNQQSLQQQPIGTTQSGLPIFADPYNSAHQQFEVQDHLDAAQQLGGAQGALHAQIALDKQSPMDRASQRFGQQGQDQDAQGQDQQGHEPQGQEFQGQDQQGQFGAQDQSGHAEEDSGGDSGQNLFAQGQQEGQDQQGQEQQNGFQQQFSSPSEGRQNAPQQQSQMFQQQPGMLAQPPIQQPPVQSAQPDMPNQLGLQAPAEQFGEQHLMEQPRQGPKPGMVEKPPIQASQGEGKAPPGLPRPQKQVGPFAPYTHAGSTDTLVEKGVAGLFVAMRKG